MLCLRVVKLHIMAGASSTGGVLVEKQMVALASRQWSCSELKEGLKHVYNDSEMPPELAELEACFCWVQS